MPLRQVREPLADPARAGRYVFAEARRAQLDFVRRHWLFLLGSTLITLLPMVPVLFVVHGSFLRGFLVGADVIATLALNAFYVVMATGTGPRIMGGNAEQWTAEGLRVLRKHGYAVIHHTGLYVGDIDHVLIGPGGVFAVETKWSATEWDFTRENHWVTSAAAQVTRNAHGLELLLRPHGVGHVEPVLVLWGKAHAQLTRSGSPFRRTSDGVVVVPGERLEQWALGRPRGVLTAAQVREVYEQLAAHTASRDARESQPVTLGVVMRSVARVVGATTAGLFAPAYLIPATGRAAGAVVLLAAVGCCLALRRQRQWRLAASGAATILVLWLALLGYDAL